MVFVGLGMALFAIILGLVGIIFAISTINRQLREIAYIFSNINECLSKIEKHLEQVDENKID